MPNPWDEINIKRNLKTLSEILANDKISIDRNGLIVRHHYFPNAFRSAGDSIHELARTERDDDYENIDKISRLFKAAVELSQKGGSWSRDLLTSKPTVFISGREINQALEGLKTLRESYKGDLEKLKSLEKIISSSEHKVPVPQFPYGYDLERYLEEKASFLNDYKEQQKLELQQKDFTMLNQGGICKAMCLDWIRRRLLKKRESYASTEKWSPPPLQNRILEKAEKHLHDLQRTTNVGDTASETRWETIVKAHTDRFSSIQETEFATVCWPIKIIQGQKASEYDRKDTLFTEVLGSTLEGVEKDETPCCFILSLRPSGKGGAGHAIVCDFRGKGESRNIYLFDPNYGEYEFGTSGKPREKLYRFFGRLWMLYAMQGAVYVKCVIKQYTTI